MKFFENQFGHQGKEVIVHPTNLSFKKLLAKLGFKAVLDAKGAAIIKIFCEWNNTEYVVYKYVPA